jgi:toxin FitB
VSGFLLDTNVASEVRKGPRANPGVLAWFESVKEAELFLSVLVLGEIRTGIERARASDPRQALALECWLIGLEQKFSDRVLPVTAAVAAEWGRLNAARPLSTVDSLLAATALVHDLTVVSRDEDGFKNTGVRLVNPFAGSRSVPA